MAKVFISYARPEVEKARKLFNDLNSIEGIEVWFDKYSLRAGLKWKPAIRKAIREADYFLALISEETTSRKGYRNTELEQALEVLQEFPQDQIFLIPIRLDECEMPRLELDELNRVDMFPKWRQGLNELLMVLAPKDKIISDKTKARKKTLNYSYRVGIADLDIGLTNLKFLAQEMNEIQKFFHFTCPELPSVKSAVIKIEGIKNLAIFNIKELFYEEHPNLGVDLIACLTRYPLAFEEGKKLLYNYFSGPSDEDERFMFISADNLYEFSKKAGCTFEEGLLYQLVGQLAVYFTDLGYHDEIRSCVMDFCEIRSYQIKGMKKKRFCNDCKKRLKPPEFRKAIEALLSWTNAS